MISIDVELFDEANQLASEFLHLEPVADNEVKWYIYCMY